MMFDTLLAQEIEAGESKTLEFKRELPKGQQIAKNLIAFANDSDGIQRIKQMCADEGLQEPEFLETGDFIDVKLYRPEPQNT